MAAAGKEIRGSGNSQDKVKVAGGTFPSVASGTGVGTAYAHSGETCASTDASLGHELKEALKKSKEEIPSMDEAELLAFEEYLRDLRRSLLQWIKKEEEEKKAVAAHRAG